MRSYNPRLGYLVFIGTMLAGHSAFAGQRTFKATLAKVPACSLANANGSATIQIDDASGAVTGTLTLSGFEGGATVAHAAIHNKDAGDNNVGGFSGVNEGAPNAQHTVTTQLNEKALPKILAGSGAIIVSSPASGCNFGAVRGNLVEEGAVPDAGTPAPDASTGEPPSTTDAGPTGGGTTGGSTPTAPTTAGEPADDGGCSQSSTRGAGGSSALLVGLVIAAMKRARRRASRSTAR